MVQKDISGQFSGQMPQPKGGNMAKNIIPILTQLPNISTKFTFGDKVKIIRGFYKGSYGRILNVRVAEERRMIGNFEQILNTISYEVFIEGWGSLWCTENEIKKPWF